MQLKQAQEIAERVKDELAPHCVKIEIAGSVRRQKADVKDIEIVCIPKRYMAPVGMFGTDKRVPDFVRIVDGFEKVKGDAETGKYCKRILPEGIALNIHITSPENFGYMLWRKTGGLQCTKDLYKKGKERGYRFEKSGVFIGSKQVPVTDEERFYVMLSEDYINPEFRI